MKRIKKVSSSSCTRSGKSKGWFSADKRKGQGKKELGRKEYISMGKD